VAKTLNIFTNKLHFCFWLQLSYFYLPVVFKFLCGPESIKSIFERVNRGSSNNIFRQSIPSICDSIAKRTFSGLAIMLLGTTQVPCQMVELRCDTCCSILHGARNLDFTAWVAEQRMSSNWRSSPEGTGKPCPRRSRFGRIGAYAPE